MKAPKVVWFKPLLVSVALLAAALPLVMGGTANAAKPEKVVFALTGDFTGPYAPITGAFLPGLQDAIKHINDDLGGVAGVPMEMVLRDNGGKVALGLQQYPEVMAHQPKPMFISIVMTPLAEALRDRLVEDDIVGFVPSSIKDLYPQGNAYGMYALYTEQAAVGLKWAIENHWKGKGRPKVGIITWDTSYGRAILEPEFFDYIKEIGFDHVGTELFGIREVDVTTHLVRLRAKSPDYIVTNTTAGGPIAIAKAMKELGMTQPFFNGGGGEWATVRLNPELFEGAFVVTATASFDEPNAGMKKVLEYWKTNDRTLKDLTLFYVEGFKEALIAHDVLETIVKSKGWDGVNTAAIKAEMNKINDVQLFGGAVRTTYTEQKRSTPWVAIYQVRGGKLINMAPGGADFIEAPDLRPKEFK